MKINTDLELINFRIPSTMKTQFQETCQSRNQQMTSVLNQFISDYINNYQPTDETTQLPLDFFSATSTEL